MCTVGIAIPSVIHIAVLGTNFQRPHLQHLILSVTPPKWAAAFLPRQVRYPAFELAGLDLADLLYVQLVLSPNIEHQ